MALVLPANATKKVPVLMMFGNGAMPASPPPADAPAAAPSSAQQLVGAGWGYASISPASIQADNGAGLTRGIIGLVNKGQARKPDDLGSLRALAWARPWIGLPRDRSHRGPQHVWHRRRFAIRQGSARRRRIRTALPDGARRIIWRRRRKLHRRNFGEASRTSPGRRVSLDGWQLPEYAQPTPPSARRRLETFPLIRTS